MGGVAKQIIGSFEDIGKDIARETVQVPKDIVGKAIESLGTNTQKTQKSQTTITTSNFPKEPEKKVPPREWLTELAGKGKKQKEPTLEERQGKEKQEKTEKEVKQAAVAQRMAPLAPVSTKAKRGNLYGVKQKVSSEMSKNVRQD